MQTHLRNFRHRNGSIGSVLIITLVLAILLGTTLASYLYWVRTQNLLVSESQAWNAALAIAEAGIEEGMAQINVNVGALNSLDYQPSIQANWQSGSGPYTKFNSSFGYTVTVSNDAPPTIYATGTNMVPLLGIPISRTVMVKTRTNSLFGVAIAAINNIKMNGDNVYVDAYDSADTNKFPGGIYNRTNALAKGDVATKEGVLNVANADIHGRVIVGPDSSYSVNTPNGLVGDMNWTGPGVQSPTSDWVITDFNKEFSDILPPYSSGLDPTGTGGPASDTNQYILGDGNYFYSGNKFTINNNKTLLVTGAAILYVTGSFDANANSEIKILNSAASLKLYVGQTTGSSVYASFGQVNNSGNAFNFQVYGLPTCTAFTLGGNGQYVGTVYAPEAALSFNGGGVVPLDFQGSCVIKSADINGKFNLHYDINLGRSGPASGYTLSSWQEL
jgi:hypothetical protein